MHTLDAVGGRERFRFGSAIGIARDYRLGIGPRCSIDALPPGKYILWVECPGLP